MKFCKRVVVLAIISTIFFQGTGVVFATGVNPYKKITRGLRVGNLASRMEDFETLCVSQYATCPWNVSEMIDSLSDAMGNVKDLEDNLSDTPNDISLQMELKDAKKTLLTLAKTQLSQFKNFLNAAVKGLTNTPSPQPVVSSVAVNPVVQPQPQPQQQPQPQSQPQSQQNQSQQPQVAQSVLSVTQNSVFAGGAIIAGSTGAKLGSFVVNVPSAEGVMVTGVSLYLNQSGISPGSLTSINNLKLTRTGTSGEVQLGPTIATVNNSTIATLVDSTPLSFTITPGITVQAGQSLTLNIFGDVSLAMNSPAVTILLSAKGVSAVGSQSQSSLAGPSTLLSLQKITLASAGTLTASMNPVYANQNVTKGVMVKVASFVLSAGSTEGIFVTTIGLTLDQSGIATGNVTQVTNLKLMRDIVQLGTVQPVVLDGSTSTWSLNTRVEAGKSVIMDVYGDLDAAIPAGTTFSTLLKVSAVNGAGINSGMIINAPSAATPLQTVTVK